MSIRLSLDEKKLAGYVGAQLDHCFPDDGPREPLEDLLGETIKRVEYCFSAIHDRYFKYGVQTYFNHLNADHYAMFLYFLSNTLYRRGADTPLCEKVFYLNKVMHGIDVFYSVEMPDIFLFCHPVGTVLGRAQYSDYFLVYQNCTIGSNHDLDYPVIGKYAAVYKGASVLGKCVIGDNCKISADSLIMDTDLQNDKIYIGTPQNYVIKNNRHHDRIWDAKG